MSGSVHSLARAARSPQTYRSPRRHRVRTRAALRRHRPGGDAAMRPLLVTSDAGLLDAVLAVAGEARVEVDVVPDVGAALRPVDVGAARAARRLAAGRGARAAAPAGRGGGQPHDRGRRDLAAASWQIGAEHAVELPEGAPWLFERLGSSLDGVPAADLVAVVGASRRSRNEHLGRRAGAPCGARRPSERARRPRPVRGRARPHARGRAHHRRPLGRARRRQRTRRSERCSPRPCPSSTASACSAGRRTAPLEPDLTAVGHVVDALSRQAGTVVLDAGRAVDVRGQAMLARCQRVVVVVPLRVRAVTAARRLLRPAPSDADAGDRGARTRTVRASRPWTSSAPSATR